MGIAVMTSDKELGVDTARRASQEVTAVISILTNLTCPNRGLNEPRAKVLDRPNIPYTIQLSLLGATILPPYLPRLFCIGRQKKRRDILTAIDRLAVSYRACYSDMHLDKEEGLEIIDRVRNIGGDIAEYLHEFVEVLREVGKLSIVSNLVIHTDDFAIPWQWVHYLQDVEEEDEGDFLMNRFPCGTLIVDGKPNALVNFKDFVLNRERTPTSAEALKGRSFCLLQGLCGETHESWRESRKYGNHFRDIFIERFPEKEVVLADDEVWRHHTTTGTLIGRLNELTANASILHYSGHIDDNTLVFDADHRVSSQDLKRHLVYLEKRPLVVLHGCASGKIRDAQRESEQLATVLLSKGASGCVVALLPVDQAVRFEDSRDSMIDLFYHKVVGRMMPYGRALFEAQREFQENPEVSHNPQWLFFQLYGDPRGMLIDSSTSTILGKLQLAAEREDREREEGSRSQGRIQVFGNKFPLTAREMEETLQRCGVGKFEIGTPRETLDADLYDAIAHGLTIVGRWVGDSISVADIAAAVLKVLKHFGVPVVFRNQGAESPPVQFDEETTTIVITEETAQGTHKTVLVVKNSRQRTCR